MSRRILLGAAGAALLVIVLAAAWLRREDPVAAKTAPVVRKDLVVSVLCEGNLEPPPGGELRARESAIVERVPAREGERVAKGAVLVVLSNPDLARQEASARAEVAALEAQRARLDASLFDAKREVDRLSKVVEADHRLQREGAVTREILEKDTLAKERALENVRSLDLERRSLVEGESSRIALARATAASLRSRLEALTVRAPSAGAAYGLPPKAGEPVAPGQVVAGVADPGRLDLRARVDQPDLPRVKPGQRFVVTFDGLPGKRFEGRIRSVSAGVLRTGGRDVAEVIGEVDDAERALPPNASVNVEIIVAESKGTLVVPRPALLRDGEKRYVLVPEGGRAARRDVTIGLLGLDDVEIATGVKEGDHVLLPGAVALAPGTRLAAAR